VIVIADSRALAEVFELRDAGQLVDHLTGLVEMGDLTFPNAVLDELKRRHQGTTCWAWATGVRNARHEFAVPWDDLQDVLVSYPELVDPYSRHETSAPAVLTLTRILARFRDVLVVTEDFGDKPGRMALASACNGEGHPAIRAGDFLARFEL